MSAADDAPDGRLHDPIAQLQHDLKTSLTTISGRAYLLDRAIRRAPSLAEEERARMLDGVTTIETAVREMVTLIDRMDDGQTDDDRHAR